VQKVRFLRANLYFFTILSSTIKNIKIGIQIMPLEFDIQTASSETLAKQLYEHYDNGYRDETLEIAIELFRKVKAYLISIEAKKRIIVVIPIRLNINI
jgi:hypothetical protein